MDRNGFDVTVPRCLRWSPPHGGVDRNDAAAMDGEVDLRRPLTGAWIETRRPASPTSRSSGRPPHGGVDRNCPTMPSTTSSASRPPHGGVNRNKGCHGQVKEPLVAPLTGAWIETHWTMTQLIGFRSPPSRGRGSKLEGGTQQRTITAVAPLTGAWIETSAACRHDPKGLVAPLTGAWIETRIAVPIRSR